MSSSLERALVQALDALDEVGFRYALVGGLAVGAWGVSRSTRDVDLYVELPTARRGELQDALQARKFHVPAMLEELGRFGVFRSRSADGVFVDIFDAVGPLGDALLEHRRELRVFGRSLWVSAPEELFLLKAFSERVLVFEDLVALARMPDIRLDQAYLDVWAQRLDESIGGNDVSERIRAALLRAQREHEAGP